MTKSYLTYLILLLINFLTFSAYCQNANIGFSIPSKDDKSFKQASNDINNRQFEKAQQTYVKYLGLIQDEKYKSKLSKKHHHPIDIIHVYSSISFYGSAYCNLKLGNIQMAFNEFNTIKKNEARARLSYEARSTMQRYVKPEIHSDLNYFFINAISDSLKQIDTLNWSSFISKYSSYHPAVAKKYPPTKLYSIERKVAKRRSIEKVHAENQTVKNKFLTDNKKLISYHIDFCYDTAKIHLAFNDKIVSYPKYGISPLKNATIWFDNGNKYVGELNQNYQFNGFGKLFLSNGTFYDGYFIEGEKHGFGSLCKRMKYGSSNISTKDTDYDYIGILSNEFSYFGKKYVLRNKIPINFSTSDFCLKAFKYPSIIDWDKNWVHVYNQRGVIKYNLSTKEVEEKKFPSSLSWEKIRKEILPASYLRERTYYGIGFIQSFNSSSDKYVYAVKPNLNNFEFKESGRIYHFQSFNSSKLYSDIVESPSQKSISAQEMLLVPNNKKYIILESRTKSKSINKVLNLNAIINKVPDRQSISHSSTVADHYKGKEWKLADVKIISEDNVIVFIKLTHNYERHNATSNVPFPISSDTHYAIVLDSNLDYIKHSEIYYGDEIIVLPNSTFLSVFKENFAVVKYDSNLELKYAKKLGISDKTGIGEKVEQITIDQNYIYAIGHTQVELNYGLDDTKIWKVDFNNGKVINSKIIEGEYAIGAFGVKNGIITIIDETGLRTYDSFFEDKVTGVIGMSLNYNKSILMLIEEVKNSYILTEREPTTLKSIRHYSFLDNHFEKGHKYLRIASAISNNGKHYAFSTYSNQQKFVQNSIIIYNLNTSKIHSSIDISNLKLKGGQACKFHFNSSGDKLYYGTALEIYEYDLSLKVSKKLHETKGYVTYDLKSNEPVTCDHEIINSYGEVRIINKQTLGGDKYVSDIAFGCIWKKNSKKGYITDIGNKQLLFTSRALEIINP